MSYENERQVAEKAAQMIETALRSKIGSLGFKNHVSAEGQKRLSDASGKYKGKDYTTSDGRKIYYLNQLAINMEKHGYILHYGDSGTRKGSTRTRHTPRTTTYKFRTHEWNLPEKDFIDDAIKQSGVIDFVLQNVGRIRGEEIILNLKNFFEK